MSAPPSRSTPATRIEPDGDLHRFLIGGRGIDYLLGGDIGQFAQLVDDQAFDRVFVVHGNHPRLRELAVAIAGTVSRCGTDAVLGIDDSEAGKTIHFVDALCSGLFSRGVTRSGGVVAVGGGVVCNLVGLAASLVYRGIGLVQVPTTLMAMSDVVLSFKQGVNFAGHKNGIGSYYAPRLVWADPAVLEGAPVDVVREGIAELIKNAFTISPQFLEVLSSLLREDGCYSFAELRQLIAMAMSSKGCVLSSDPAECGPALCLEYGHTVGHALELLSGGRIRHGVAVGLGMRVAGAVAAELGVIRDHYLDLQTELIARAGLPLTCRAADAATVDRGELAAQLRRDNKRGLIAVGPEEVPMVLIEGPGCPIPRGLPLTPVPIGRVTGLASQLILCG